MLVFIFSKVTLKVISFCKNLRSAFSELEIDINDYEVINKLIRKNKLNYQFILLPQGYQNSGSLSSGSIKYVTIAVM